MSPMLNVDPDESTAARFVYELRRYRLMAGLTQVQLGRRVGFSGSMIGAVETLQRVPTLEMAELCDKAFGLNGVIEPPEQDIRRMTSTSHRLVVCVSRARTLDTDIYVWHASPIDAPMRSGVNGEALSELFEEVEAVKHFILGLPKETPVDVEYVYELPVGPSEVLASHRRRT